MSSHKIKSINIVSSYQKSIVDLSNKWNNNFSLLKLNPETGRKHQLRKQLLIHGYPVLGDNKYRLSLNKKKGELMLHAYKINFSINDVKYNFLAKPHEPFIKTLKEKYLKNFL